MPTETEPTTAIPQAIRYAQRGPYTVTQYIDTSTTRSAGSSSGVPSTVICSMHTTKIATHDATGRMRHQGNGASTATETSAIDTPSGLSG